ncbi:MAG: pyridine nucleotide-disulfide oxidoreductase [Chitinivibrionales bacterium]|nr:pyridine nucleotide-disulfide oxidoreductase [Chitinivibrionales bacterium]
MKKRVLIVGGVAGGASFAARMRRLDENAEIVMFERGEYISFANCGLPYHIGDTIKNRDQLIIQTPKSFKERYNVDVEIATEVIGVDTRKKEITVSHRGEERQERYDYLLLSPGSKPVRPQISGIDNPKILTLRSIPDMDRIKKIIDAGDAKSVAVIGAGFIGLEMAENLRHRGLEVSVVEMADQVFLPADKEMANTIHKHMVLNGVNIIVDNGVSSFETTNDDKIRLNLAKGSGPVADFVVLAIGVRPDTAFLKGSGIELTDRGAIIVDKHMRTKADNVFAVGDAIEVTDFISGKKVHVPLAGPANRQGRIAGDTIAGKNSEYKSTQGTAVCKVFDLAIAVTGINEKNAMKCEIPYIKSYTHSASHATYYPGAYPLSIKLLFAPDTGKVLGAQIVGKKGVDKRIDVFATAIRHGLKIDDLTELELAYAPPFGSAKDPVNMAGFVAENIRDKLTDVFYAEDITGFDPQKQQLLDVRTVEEHDQGSIEGSMNIPIDELRGRLKQLDKNKEVMVYCQIGLRGYLATRILSQNGFSAKNLSGGFTTYSSIQTPDYDPVYLKTITAPACSSPAQNENPKDMVKVDACGLQCPGPIMQLKKAVDSASEGQGVEITATDQGFALDVPAWCTRTGNTLLSLAPENGAFKAVIQKGRREDICTVEQPAGNKKTMVIFSNDLDRMMAAFIIANGASAMGSDVVLFFTFWGLNLLRKKSNGVKIKKSIMEKMFGMMMPRGPEKTKLSKMNMGGMGTAMMQQVMKKKNVFSLQELVGRARSNNIRFVACSMSMDIMGIKKEELIDGIEFGGVSYYLNEADNAAYNLFI